MSASRFPEPRTIGRRPVLAALLGVGIWGRVGLARAIGDSSRIRLARLHLPDLPDPRPTALRRLAWELERRTSLIAVPDPIALAPASPELFRYPLILLSGDRAFSLPAEVEMARLRRFLTFGGCLLVDSAEGRAGRRFRRVGAQAAGACPAWRHAGPCA